MISSFENNSILSDLAIPELLSEKKKQIEQLLSCSEKWEKNINILCTQKRKSSEIVNNTWHINRKDFEVKQR